MPEHATRRAASKVSTPQRRRLTKKEVAEEVAELFRAGVGHAERGEFRAAFDCATDAGSRLQVHGGERVEVGDGIETGDLYVLVAAEDVNARDWRHLQRIALRAETARQSRRAVLRF